MKRILHPFDQQFYGNNRFYPVFISIETERGYLSITGVQSPLPSGNSRGGCGQIVMEYDHRDKLQNDARYHNLITVNELRFSKGWDAEKWYDLLNVWELWHLKQYVDVPQDVVEFLLSLPDTDRHPAWV